MNPIYNYWECRAEPKLVPDLIKFNLTGIGISTNVAVSHPPPPPPPPPLHLYFRKAPASQIQIPLVEFAHFITMG